MDTPRLARSAATVACLAGILTVFTTLAWADEAAPDFAALGSGSLTIELRQGASGEAFVASVTTEIDGLSGIVVREPGTRHELVRITSSGATALVTNAVPDVAGATVETTELRGTFRTKVPGDITHMKALEVLLVRADGTVYPLRVRTATTIANSVLHFSLAASNCVTVKVTCSGCTAEETCCGARKEFDAS